MTRLFLLPRLQLFCPKVSFFSTLVREVAHEKSDSDNSGNGDFGIGHSGFSLYPGLLGRVELGIL